MVDEAPNRFACSAFVLAEALRRVVRKFSESAPPTPKMTLVHHFAWKTRGRMFSVDWAYPLKIVQSGTSFPVVVSDGDQETTRKMGWSAFSV